LFENTLGTRLGEIFITRCWIRGVIEADRGDIYDRFCCSVSSFYHTLTQSGSGRRELLKQIGEIFMTAPAARPLFITLSHRAGADAGELLKKIGEIFMTVSAA
jgi:hypothetical protein